jgi:hypothetical protein
VNWRSLSVGAVIGALLASVVAVAIWPRRKPQPPAVATVVDTLVQVVNGETVYTVEYKPDPAASRELTKLRDELAGYRSTVERITGYLGEMEVENRYLADSLTRLTLDSLRGIVRVTRGPAGLAVVSYRRGLVETWRLPVWRQRWTLLAGADKPMVKASRLPVDLGLFLAGGFDTPPDTWLPKPYAYAGLAITRQSLTASVGPYFDGKLKLRANVRLDWRL